MPERARVAWFWIDEFGSRIPGATVEVRNAANTAAITDTLYAADDPDTSVLPNPFTSDVNGKAEAYLANAKRAIFRFSKTGYATQDVPVDFTFPANRFLFRNAWVNTTAYVANDVVRYNNESWIALRASTGVTPVEGADWSKMLGAQDLSGYQALSDHDTFVGARVYRSAAQSIPNATDTAVSFDAETRDTNNIHDNATNPSRLTVPAGKGGTWRIKAQIRFVPNGTGQRYCIIKKNGATDLASKYEAGTAGIETFVDVSDEAVLVAGDYIEIFTYQNSGAALNLEGGTVVSFATFSLVGK